MNRNSRLILVIGCLLMSLIPILSRNPLIYSDTKAYYMVGEQIFNRVLLRRTGDTATKGVEARAGSVVVSTAGAAAKPDDPRLAFTVAGARSPTFSLMLYMVTHLTNAWAWLALNVILVSLSLYFLMEELDLLRHAIAIYGTLALFTGIPEMCAFLMPDIFTVTAGICILYFAVTPSLQGSAVFMAGLLAFSLSCHPTNLVIAVYVAAIGGAAHWKRLPRVMAIGRGGLLVLGGCVVLAAGTGSIYSAAVGHVEHRALLSPPFLTARLYADGPGRGFAQRSCAADPHAFEICRYLSQMPLTSNDVLWTHDPRRGLFELADYDSRVRLIGEQGRFVVGTVLAAPLDVAGSAFRNFVAQLGYFQIDETYGSPRSYFTDPRFVLFRSLMPGGEACAANPELCEPWLDRTLLNISLGLGIILSLCVIVGRAPRLLSRGAAASEGRSGLRLRAGLYAVAIILTNAAVCGILSMPAERYQLRVSWLYEFVAILCVVEWYDVHKVPIWWRGRSTSR